MKFEDFAAVFDDRVELLQVEFALRVVQQEWNLLVPEFKPLGVVRLFPAEFFFTL